MLQQTLLLLLSGALVAFLQISGTHSFPQPLSGEEETKLFHEMKAGNADARKTLICRNLRLVSHIVRKYYPTAQNPDDLISIGTVGLIKAVDTFDPDKGAHFATYASRCLQNEILMHFRTQKKYGAEVSMQETIDTDREGNPLTYMDIIAEEDTIADDIDIKLRCARVRKLVVSVLNAREREIIILRYGLSGAAPLPQRLCAERLGISRSYVSRIEKAALEKLRDHM
ncbi:MAG: sigma-70 family RNA polymerase sigma factor [Ruminococcaceae bacterium]|nr:sigma-70 family RNA polymerase sigma factor [Oscillospiraceae bacterium]